MPKIQDIKKVLVIGSGPIIIGQAAEFDYAGTQACRSLKEEGIEVVLLNSNPATIMTDKDIADKVYIEPLTVEVVEHPQRKTGQCSAYPGRPGRTESGYGAGGERFLKRTECAPDRNHIGDHQKSRGPPGI